MRIVRERISNDFLFVNAFIYIYFGGRTVEEFQIDNWTNQSTEIFQCLDKKFYLFYMKLINFI